MKKIKFLIFLITIFLPIYRVSALTNPSVTLSCGTPTNPGSSITCTLSGTSTGGAVSSFDTDITFSNSNLTFGTFTKSSIWEGSGNNGTIRLYTGTNKVGAFAIGTFTVNINAATPRANYTVSATNISLGNETFGNQSIANVTSGNILVRSTVNTLSALSLTGGTLSPSFASSTTTYTATVNAVSTTISATRTDATYSTITGDGARTLNYGSNALAVVVTSETGSAKTYTITVTRPDNRSTNNNLASLTVGSGSLSPAFSASTTTYSVSVANSISSIAIGASKANSQASFTSGYGPRTVDSLSVGNNAIQIKVTAENGSEKTYTINVTRAAAEAAASTADPASAATEPSSTQSTNAYLKSLSISSGTLVFAKDTLSYNVTVPFSTTSVTTTAVTEDTKSKTVVTGGDKLIDGKNTITVVVTAESGATKTYTIIVSRLAEGIELSDVNYLSKLSISKSIIKFDKNTLNYTISTNGAKTLTIIATPEDPTAGVTIAGNSNLKNGSIIRISVVAQNGDIKVYTITIKNRVNGFIIALLAILAVATVGGAGFLIWRHFSTKSSQIDSDSTPVEPTYPSSLATDSSYSQQSSVPAPEQQPTVQPDEGSDSTNSSTDYFK